jgi:hypothetical protein
VTGPGPGAGSGPGDSARDPGAELRADWIGDVDAALSAAGLATQLQQTAGGLDITATIHQPGRKTTYVIVDEDGYVEIHWWSSAEATPQQVADAIRGALAALTTAPAAGQHSTPP